MRISEFISGATKPLNVDHSVSLSFRLTVCYRLVKSAATSFSETRWVCLPLPWSPPRCHLCTPPFRNTHCPPTVQFHSLIYRCFFCHTPACKLYISVHSFSAVIFRTCIMSVLSVMWKANSPLGLFLSANSDELGHVFSCAEPIWRDLAVFFLNTSQHF